MCIWKLPKLFIRKYLCNVQVLLVVQKFKWNQDQELPSCFFSFWLSPFEVLQIPAAFHLIFRKGHISAVPVYIQVCIPVCNLFPAKVKFLNIVHTYYTLIILSNTQVAYGNQNYTAMYVSFTHSRCLKSNVGALLLV